MSLDHTHDPARRSWVESANRPGGDFPLQNLPHGVFSTATRDRRGGVAIGDSILDLRRVLELGLLDGDLRATLEAAAAPLLNDFVGLGNEAASRLRAALSDLLSTDGKRGSAAAAEAGRLLVPMSDATLAMPVRVGAFTDFMTSVHHVSAARRARPARPLGENFLHLPVGYNSRASSITPDGVPVQRPWGQFKSDSGDVVFAPTRQLDFELEFGAIVGTGNALGQRVTLDAADERIFGYVIVNDWSARDIQAWESRLGPFLGKSFRTSISPWIVTAAAVAPFRTAAPRRAADQPRPLPHLDSAAHRRGGALDVRLEAWLTSQRMRESGRAPMRIVDTNLLHCAWTLPQMLTHHTSNGCNLEPGDLLSSGTVSGPEDEAAACLFERTAGTLPLELPGGERRCWLEDGDELVLTARAARAGVVGIGFGRCGAQVVPAAAPIGDEGHA